MYMNRIFIVSTFIFFLPTLALANDYYWRIGQCQPGIQSEACDGKIVSLSLTDATHYGELKLINLPSSIGEAMTLSSCDSVINSLVNSLKYYDAQNPYTSYNTDIVMIRNKNEERFNIVINSEDKIKACIVNHPKLLEEEAKKKAEEQARIERLAEVERALKTCDFSFFEVMTSKEKMDTYKERTACQKQQEDELLKQKQLEEERIKKENEEAEQRHREIDEAAARTLAEQVSQQAPAATPMPVSAPVAESEIEESKKVIETVIQEPISEEKAIEEEIIDPEMVVEPTPEPKPSFFQKIKNFFSRWF